MTRVEKNPGFFKKAQPNWVFCFFEKKTFFLLFLKTRFVLFLWKMEKPYSKLFLLHHAISLF